MSASWWTPGLLRVGLVPKEVLIQYKLPGDPGPLFGTIPLPIHQVLEAPGTTSSIQNVLDRKGRMVGHIGEEGWLGGRETWWKQA